MLPYTCTTCTIAPSEASGRKMSSCFAPNAIRGLMKSAPVAPKYEEPAEIGSSVLMAWLVGVSSIRIRFISRCQTAGTRQCHLSEKENPNSEDFKAPTCGPGQARCTCPLLGKADIGMKSEAEVLVGHSH